MTSNVFLRRTLVFVGFRNGVSRASNLSDLKEVSLSLRYCSSTVNEQSFKVSYLINSCGFTQQAALSASKYVNFSSSERPDSVISFFQEHGFAKSEINKLIKRFPVLLSYAEPEKRFLPKIDFFYSKGMSRNDLAKSLFANPSILGRSLEDQISPSFDFFRTLLGSNDKVIAAIKRFPDILVRNPQTYVVPNVAILQEYGVPESNAMVLLTKQPRAFIVKPDRFKEVVEEVKSMGINPQRLSFVMAVHAKRAVSKLTWEKKMDIYRKWGWSEEEIILAFVKHPWCMLLSEDKITATMDTFVNKMGMDSSLIARRPQLVSLSLEKRIAPRCSVAQFLLSKGLIERQISWTKLFESTEKSFLEKYVACYEEEAPDLLKLYQEKLCVGVS